MSKKKETASYLRDSARLDFRAADRYLKLGRPREAKDAREVGNRNLRFARSLESGKIPTELAHWFEAFREENGL